MFKTRLRGELMVIEFSLCLSVAVLPPPSLSAWNSTSNTSTLVSMDVGQGYEEILLLRCQR
jgi:hypothetical protein